MCVWIRGLEDDRCGAGEGLKVFAFADSWADEASGYSVVYGCKIGSSLSPILVAEEEGWGKNMGRYGPSDIVCLLVCVGACISGAFWETKLEGKVVCLAWCERLRLFEKIEGHGEEWRHIPVVVV
jgi:hypothetical protein